MNKTTKEPPVADRQPWITALSHDAEHVAGWDHATGNPGVASFSNAIQVWSLAQGRSCTVQEAALAFNVEPELIREAVKWHYWMFLLGDLIEHEGE